MVRACGCSPRATRSSPGLVPLGSNVRWFGKPAQPWRVAWTAVSSGTRAASSERAQIRCWNATARWLGDTGGYCAAFLRRQRHHVAHEPSRLAEQLTVSVCGRLDPFAACRCRGRRDPAAWRLSAAAAAAQDSGRPARPGVRQSVARRRFGVCPGAARAGGFSRRPRRGFRPTGFIRPRTATQTLPRYSLNALPLGFGVSETAPSPGRPS